MDKSKLGGKMVVMHPFPWIKKATFAASFLTRHLVASLATILMFWVGWTVAYIALFLFAIVTNSGLGGPLAYPAGLIFFGIFSIFACGFLLFPASVLSELLLSGQPWSLMKQIVMSSWILILLCAGAVCVVSRTNDLSWSMSELAMGGGILYVFLAIPFGLYWWIAEGGSSLLSWIVRRAG